MQVLLTLVAVSLVACYDDLVNLALLYPAHRYQDSTMIGPSIKQAFLDAVDEVNMDTTVRLRVNGYVYNSHMYTDSAYIGKIMSSMRKKKITAIVGAMNATVTKAYLDYMAANNFSIPMVSYSTKTDNWSNFTYSNFMRVIPSNSQLAKAVALACKGLKWDEVALMHINDEEGYDFAKQLGQQLRLKDIDIINFRQAVSHGNGTLENVIQSIDVNCAKIIVIYAPTELTLEFLKEAARRGYSGEDFNYVLVTYDNTIVTGMNSMNEEDRDNLWKALQGSVWVGVKTTENINPTVGNYVRDATYVSAKAAEKVIFGLQDVYNVGVFMVNMRDVEFEGRTGFVEFEDAGYNRLIGHYYLWNWMSELVMEPILLLGFNQATTVHPTPVWAGGERTGWDDIPDSDSCADDDNFDLWWVFLIVGIFVLLLVILCTYSRYSKAGREVAADPNIYGSVGESSDATKRTPRVPEDKAKVAPESKEEEKVPQAQQQPAPLEKHFIDEENIPAPETKQDPAIEDTKQVEKEEVPEPQKVEEVKEEEQKAEEFEEAKKEEEKIEEKPKEDEPKEEEKPKEEEEKAKEDEEKPKEEGDNEDKKPEEAVDVGEVGDVEKDVAAEEAKEKTEG